MAPTLVSHSSMFWAKYKKFKWGVQADQMAMPDIDELGFEERLGLLVDREVTERESRRLTRRLRRAKLKHNAALEDINYHSPRGLDKGLTRLVHNAYKINLRGESLRKRQSKLITATITGYS